MKPDWLNFGVGLSLLVFMCAWPVGLLCAIWGAPEWALNAVASLAIVSLAGFSIGLLLGTAR